MVNDTTNVHVNEWFNGLQLFYFTVLMYILWWQLAYISLKLHSNFTATQLTATRFHRLVHYGDGNQRHTNLICFEHFCEIVCVLMSVAKLSENVIRLNMMFIHVCTSKICNHPASLIFVCNCYCNIWLYFLVCWAIWGEQRDT